MKRNKVITGTRDIKIEIRNGNLADISKFIKMAGLCDMWNYEIFSFSDVLEF